MTEDPQPQAVAAKTTNKAEQIASYLRTRPQDLIDICCLMRRFHASTRDFQHAFLLLEHPLHS